MRASFTIAGRLPSYNEYINSCRRAWYIGASFKKKQTKRVSMELIAAGVPKFTRPVLMHFRWFERDRRRDRDNIRSGEKYIMDALTERERITNDTQKWVIDSHHEILLDKQNPRIEIDIEEIQ